jgi:hypothetical protein
MWCKFINIQESLQVKKHKFKKVIQILIMLNFRLIIRTKVNKALNTRNSKQKGKIKIEFRVEINSERNDELMFI